MICRADRAAPWCSRQSRSLGAKDWGVMIEGHGGMLDRMDSVCFAAPLFFHLVRYFFPG